MFPLPTFSWRYFFKLVIFFFLSCENCVKNTVLYYFTNIVKFVFKKY